MALKKQSAWHPLLDGELRARAEHAVAELAGALAEAAGVSSSSLAGGAPGLALFYGYLERTWPGRGYEDAASAFLDSAIDSVGSEQLDASLFGGFTGVAWATEQLLGPELADDDEDPNAAIDDALLSMLEETPWRGNHDLIVGLTGFAVYALERVGRASARACLDELLAHLEQTAERRGGRATWKTRPELLDEHTRRDHPDGYYNLGVSHGVPGVAVILASMVRAGIGEGRARKLLDEASA